MPRTLWFDKTFDFSLPDDAYPGLMERLRALPARIESAVQGLDHDVLVRRDGEHWSIQEHVGHLADLDAVLFLPRLDDFDAGAPVLTAADLENRTTHEARHNERSFVDTFAALKLSRATIMARLDALPPAGFTRRSVHPRLQKTVRLLDLMQFQAEHDDHHVESIAELRARFGAPARS